MQFLNSPPLPSHIGAEPGRSKRETLLFDRPDSAPIYGAGKKGEVRNWTMQRGDLEMANTLSFLNTLMHGVSAGTLLRCRCPPAVLAVIQGGFNRLLHQDLLNSIVISLGIQNRVAGFFSFRGLNQVEIRVHKNGFDS